MERETRIELATNSLEGCDSTTELLPLKTVGSEQCTVIRSSAAEPIQRRPAAAHCALPTAHLKFWS